MSPQERERRLAEERVNYDLVRLDPEYAAELGIDTSAAAQERRRHLLFLARYRLRGSRWS